MSTVDTLRSERNGRTIPLARFYSDFKIASTNICYGFVEGKDDPSYYRTIINNHLPTGCSIILYQSNGKENVKYIFDELSKRNYPSNRISFFMDRDLSPMVDDPHLIEDRQVYVTDLYSIENDILSEDTLINVMQDILGFSFFSIEELNKMKQHFKKERGCFEDLMMPIMANIIFWKRNNLKPANYKNLRIKDLIILSDTCMVSLRYPIEKTVQILYKQSNVDYDKYYNKEAVDNIISEINEKDFGKQILRGKYLASFFIEYCNSLCDHCDNMGIYRNNGRKLCANDIMDTVAPRSKPPYSLVHFVKSTIMQYYNEL